jgi:hypothetical protein
MGVSGAAHTQPEQPAGHVPITGAWQEGPFVIGPGTTQQSWPAMQHCVPQQKSNVGHAMPMHGGVPQEPSAQ